MKDIKFRILVTLVLTLIITNIYSQTEKIVHLDTGTGEIEGTLSTPDTTELKSGALIIAGSGPTDRNGNNPMMTNNSLKMLSEFLVENGVSTLRYDKRGIAASSKADPKEIDLRFENYIDDAKKWIDYLKDTCKYDEIIVIGHSQGSLIGMIASKQKNVDKFISIAGAGESAGDILRTQLKSQPTTILNESIKIIEKLEKGKTIDNIPQYLNTLFRPSIQPFLISWMKYNPQKEIKKLKTPILIIQGDTDIQVTIDDANNLAKANPRATLGIIYYMNHIMKESDMERDLNIKTYNNPDLPIKDELKKAIIQFLK